MELSNAGGVDTGAVSEEVIITFAITCGFVIQCGCVLSVAMCFTEPGYYEDGKFGIRIENCIQVVKAETKVAVSSLRLNVRNAGLSTLWIVCSRRLEWCFLCSMCKVFYQYFL